MGMSRHFNLVRRKSQFLSGTYVPLSVLQFKEAVGRPRDFKGFHMQEVMFVSIHE